MAKQLLYSDAARAAILKGVNQLADAVKATLGPKGRNAILDKKFGAPTITKDNFVLITADGIARRMDVVDHEGHPIHLGVRALVYWPWLLKEIAKSAWEVSKIILNPRLPISPTLVRFAPSQKTDVGLVMHAQSITLTPGTITIEAEPGEFLVHALTQAGGRGVIGSEMDRRVSACESKR